MPRSPPVRLDATWVIHTVGPVWAGGDAGEAGLLERCYRRSLEEAERIGATRSRSPAISTGVYGYPIEPAADVAARTVRHGWPAHERPGRVVFCTFDARIDGGDRRCAGSLISVVGERGGDMSSSIDREVEDVAAAVVTGRVEVVPLLTDEVEVEFSGDDALDLRLGLGQDLAGR